MAEVAGGVQRTFLTVPELEQRLGVSKWTLTEWRAKNYGPVWARMRGRIVYPLTEVEQFEADLVTRAQAVHRVNGPQTDDEVLDAPDNPKITTARREPDVAVDEHVRRVVDASPPLSAQQRDRLAVLLRPRAGGDAG